MRRLGAALVALVLSLTSCAVVSSMAETERALESAGFHDVGVNYTVTDGAQVVQVDYESWAATPEGFDAELDEIARIVWGTSRLRLDRVVVRPTGTTRSARYARSELAATYGPRRVDEKPLGELVGLRRLLLVAGLVMGGLVLLAVVIAVLVVRAVRRRRPAHPYPYMTWRPPSR